MSSQGAMQLDMREFDKAVADYAAASNKDFAEVCNRSLNNLAIQGLKLQKEAERSAIDTLQDKEWWPKYIAKLMVKRSAISAVKTAAKAKTVRAQARAFAKITNRRRMYTMQQAIVYSKRVIRKRLVAVKFMKFFFAAMSKAVAPFAKMPSKSSKPFNGFQSRIVPATASRQTTICEVIYNYTKRTARTARKTMRLLDGTMKAAIPATISDMQQYISRQIEKRAKQFSAKGAT